VNRYRPIKDEYIAVAKLLQSDMFLKIDENTFISEMIRLTNGNTTSLRAKQIYYSLVREAGV
jgi:hypothetical protein